MADTREIVIKLKVVGKGDGEVTEKEKNTDSVSGLKILNNIIHPVKSLEKALSNKVAGAGMVMNYAIQAVKSNVLYVVNRNFSLREDYQNEVTMSNAFGLIGKASSFGSAIAGGAIAGSAGGPVGAIVGAVIGATGWTVNQFVGASQKYDQQQIALNEMNQQSTFQRTRLGLIDGGRGTEN